MVKKETLMVLGQNEFDLEKGLDRFQGDVDAYARFLLQFKEDRLFYHLLEHLRFRMIEEAMTDRYLLMGIAENLGMVGWKNLLEEMPDHIASDGLIDEDYRLELEQKYQTICNLIERTL